MYDDLLGPRKEILNEAEKMKKETGAGKGPGLGSIVKSLSGDPNAKPAKPAANKAANKLNTVSPVKPDSDKDTDVWSDVEELIDEDDQCAGDCSQCADWDDADGGDCEA